MPAIHEMTAMMWKAFSQRYMAAWLAPAHALEHLLDMRDRRRRQNAMAEIENERAAGQHRHHVIDFALECGAAGEQRQRIDIALHHDPRLQHVARDLALECPIEPDAVHAGHL